MEKWMVAYFAALGIVLATTGLHIPDGYLSPVTSAILFALVLPFWIKGVRDLRARVNAQTIPLVALMAAFSFIIMMFNVPLPGGTTGHAVGAAIAGIVLGPGVATIAVSIALIIQALVFGDGGILAIGANCFTMAVAMPYVADAIYRAIVGAGEPQRVRSLVGGAVAGYVSLAVAALLTAFLFGIQPALYTDAAGTPLYAPYPLSVAIPAMMIPHLAVACPVEALLTVAILGYLWSARPALLTSQAAPAPSGAAAGRLTGLWIALAALIIIVPVGLLAPGTAWGEWGAHELSELGLDFIPAGLERLGSLWGAPIPDYDIPALCNVNISYWLSAIVGTGLTVLVIWLISKLVVRKSVNEERAG